MNFGVFCYDFPHWKTQNGLFAMFVNGFKPDLVAAAPWRELNIVPSKRITHKGLYLMQPRDICSKLGFDYFSTTHDNDLMDGLDFAVILGSRMLRKETIRCLKHGVVNFHPGILPENRGLDNVKWAVKKNLPQGVTAHFINEKVDAGYIISKHEVPVYLDDTLVDIQFRVQNKEVEVLIDTLKGFKANGIKMENYEKVNDTKKTFKCMTESEEKTMNFTKYRKGRGI